MSIPPLNGRAGRRRPSLPIQGYALLAAPALIIGSSVMLLSGADADGQGGSVRNARTVPVEFAFGCPLSIYLCACALRALLHQDRPLHP
ncbi:hypothetical protein EU513_03665 [Yimella sp. RIT 621]|uniref:hypothetical protein n=1 Tax=Yimella sp. RIT 621 TaxID=2510323 RepID=UPI00101C87B3|nr:hypothetical protein [Yimella sp. RIT 621]RYG78166.1 hypothetical protein EU513_03665 [Yimella sp. RIT 621]